MKNLKLILILGGIIIFALAYAPGNEKVFDSLRLVGGIMVVLGIVLRTPYLRIPGLN